MLVILDAQILPLLLHFISSTLLIITDFLKNFLFLNVPLSNEPVFRRVFLTISPHVPIFIVVSMTV